MAIIRSVHTASLVCITSVLTSCSNLASPELVKARYRLCFRMTCAWEKTRESTAWQRHLSSMGSGGATTDLSSATHGGITRIERWHVLRGSPITLAQNQPRALFRHCGAAIRAHLFPCWMTFLNNLLGIQIGLTNRSTDPFGWWCRAYHYPASRSLRRLHGPG